MRESGTGEMTATTSQKDGSFFDASGGGVDVSRADWEFADWQRGVDYTY